MVPLLARSQGAASRAHTARFCGILQADAYSGFAPLYQSGRIVEASCWAHARRKFYDFYVADRSPIAAEAMQRIGALYAIEREIRGSMPAKRAMVRQERAGPLLAATARVAVGDAATVSAKSRACRGDPIRAGALDGTHPLSRRWAYRDR